MITSTHMMTSQHVRLRRLAGSAEMSSGTSGGVAFLLLDSGTITKDCRCRAIVCQAAMITLIVLCFLTNAAAGDAEDVAADVRQAVERLKQLERTCIEYTGPNAARILDATILEAVRLYEGAKYEPAIDTVLLAWSLSPEDEPRTYHGVDSDKAEIAVQWPSDRDADLIAVDAQDQTWVIVSIKNLSDISIDLSGLRASVMRDGRAVRDSADEPVTSLAFDDLRQLLGNKAGLVPESVEAGAAATFVMVLPAFDQWTEMRFAAGDGKLDVAVRDYAAMREHLAALRQARKLAEAYRAEMAEEPQADEPGEVPPPKAEPDPYALVGLIRNEIQPGKYGIQLLDAKLAKKHKIFYVRKEGINQAELNPIGSGTIAEVTTKGYEPKQGDRVYVYEKPK